MDAIYPLNFPTCPVCRAKPGAFCRRDNGRSGPHVAPHPDRTKAARRDAIRVTNREAAAEFTDILAREPSLAETLGLTNREPNR